LNGYLLALIIFLTYLLVLAVGKKLMIWERLNIDLWGPIMMWKTKRGRAFIERYGSRERLWRRYGRVSIGVCIGAMVLLMLLLIWEAYIVLSIPRSFAPTPELMLGIPGINPIIPLGYGILGLALAIFFHEFAHGFLSIAGKIKVESLGLLFMIFPIGAFVEPNEEELNKTSRNKRMRLFAAGPATNIFVAAICLLLLLGVVAPAAEPVHEGSVVVGIASNSPADEFDIETWSEVLAVDDITISNSSELNSFSFDEPGEPVDIKLFYRGEISTMTIPGGIVLSPITDGPAYEAGIRSGMILRDLNDETVESTSDLKEILESVPADVPLNITVLEYDDQTDWFVTSDSIDTITLVSKWSYYEEHFPTDNKEEYRNISYMAVITSVCGLRTEDSTFLEEITAHPFAGVESTGDLTEKSLRYIALPFLGYSPAEPPMTDLYEISGVLGALPTDLYWILLNSLYWVFWLNLMVGIFNALPAVPLDGGYIFKDLLKGMFERRNRRLERANKKTVPEEKMDRLVFQVSAYISLLVLFLILWQLIGPYL